MKERIDNLEFIKINIFLSEKDIIKRMKRDTEWEKIFAKDISYKEPYPQYKKNSNNPTIRREEKKKNLLFFFDCSTPEYILTLIKPYCQIIMLIS